MKNRTLCFMLAAGVVLSCLTGCEKKEEAVTTVSKSDEKNSPESDEITAAATEATTGVETVSKAETTCAPETAPNIETSTGDENTPGAKEEAISKNTSTDLTSEILAVEEAYLKWEKQLQVSHTNEELVSITGQEYQLWDDALNSLWCRFSESASKDLKATVLKEQRAWIKNKEAQIKRVGTQCEEIYLCHYIENMEATALTRDRCYEMAGYLAKATGQSFDLDVPLDFVDRQGTFVVYSDLTTEEVRRDDCIVAVSIYRLATLRGKAIKQKDGTYSFEEENWGVKGIIHVFDDHSGAAFEVTQSNCELIKAGEGAFQFPERRLQTSK